jgi:hypothetical protein
MNILDVTAFLIFRLEFAKEFEMSVSKMTSTNLQSTVELRTKVAVAVVEELNIERSTLPRNLSNHMDMQTRTGDTVLVRVER